MNNGRTIRIGFSIVILFTVAALSSSYLTTPEAAGSAVAAQAERPFAEREPIAPPRENVTVITGQGFGERPGDAIIAFAPDGRVLYYNDSLGQYQDVDPEPDGRYTVSVIGSEFISPEDCDATTRCIREYLLEINLSTGSTDVLQTFVAPARHAQKIHDVDRIGDNEYVVADTSDDRIYEIHTTTGVTDFEWRASSEFPRSGGGKWPDDWAHLNDVEEVPDGRYMASLRNQDQVVFIDRETGLEDDWTLGAEDDYSILYEQHQPDYIPEQRGGPAVVVADSHNDRIVEFQRHNGSWTQSWEWTDSELLWPRDADRLPNGHTLIVDSNGGRVLEIDQGGSIVWQVNLTSAYDAERLGTGDESLGGHSAAELNLTDAGIDSERRSTAQSSSPLRPLFELVPSKVTSAVVFVLPAWMGFVDAIVVALGLVSLLGWVAFEIRHRYSISVSSPIDLERK